MEDTFSLEIPSGSEERIYHETISDEELHSKHDLVFTGDFTTQHSEPATSGQRR